MNNDRIDRLEEQLRPAEDRGFDLIFQYHQTVLDPATGDRRTIELVVPREELEQTCEWSLPDGGTVRVFRPRRTPAANHGILAEGVD